MRDELIVRSLTVGTPSSSAPRSLPTSCHGHNELYDRLVPITNGYNEFVPTANSESRGLTACGVVVKSQSTIGW